MIVDRLHDLRPLVGQTLGTSGWVEVGQPRTNQFAGAPTITSGSAWIQNGPGKARSAAPSRTGT